MPAAPESMSVAHLIAVHTDLAQRLGGFDTTAIAAAAITGTAVAAITGADWAGLTRLDPSGRLFSVGTTDPVVEQVDRVQYDLRSGPCVEVTLTEHPYATGNLRYSSQWPEFGRRSADLGVQSMLSHRLFLDLDGETANRQVIGGLNLYSRTADAFDLDQALPVLSMLASHAALALWGGTMADHAASLETALGSSRDIGTAQGILIERFKITRDAAFDLLSAASQATNRKLRDVATDLVDTGVLAVPERSRPRHGRRSS